MELSKILKTAKLIDEHEYKSRLENFFLLLNLHNYDNTFYDIASLLSEPHKQQLLTTINLLENNDQHSSQDEEHNKQRLVNILNATYLQAIKYLNIKDIAKLRHAFYEFAVKHDIELKNLIQGGEKQISSKRLARKIAKHQDKYQNLEKVKTSESDWINLIDKIHSLTHVDVEQLFQAEPTSEVKNIEESDLEAELKADKDKVKYLQALQTAKANKDNMEKYLKVVQKLVLADQSIPLKDIKDVKQLLVKIYYDYRLTQDLSSINKAIKIKEEAEVEHYDDAFKEIKNTLAAVVGYRFLFMKIDSPRSLDTDHFEGVSKKYNNNPILILRDGKFYLYGHTGGSWTVTELDQDAFNEEYSKHYSIKEYLNSLLYTSSDNEPIVLNDKVKRKLPRKIRKVHTLDDHASKTALRSHSPSFFSDKPILWEKGLDYSFYQIINLLANLGLYKELEGLKAIVSRLEQDSKLSNLERTKRVLDIMYGIFNSLSVLEDVEGNRMVADEDLKSLKKHIHGFADKHHFEKKIFNLAKLYRKADADENINESLHHTPNRKYAYIDNLAQEITQRKLNERQRKKGLNLLSLGASLTVGIGEGVIAAVFFGVFFPPVLLLIGFAGFAVNYYLFRNDSYHTLKEFFAAGLFKNIFKDEKGNEVSDVKKVGTVLALVSVLGSSVAFSVFTFSAVFTLLITLSLPFPPLAAGIALFFAAAMFIANTGVFYRIAADFIKNDRIIQIGEYFKHNFYDVFKPEKAWKDLTTKQKVTHGLKVAGKLLFNTTFLGLKILLCATITAATLGLGYKYSLKVLSTFTNFSSRVIHLASAITIYGIASPANSFFYWKGNIKVVNAVKSSLEWVGSKFGNLGSTIREGWKVFNANRIRRVNVLIAVAKTTVLTGLAILNGIGQGSGAYNTPKSIAFVQKALQTILAPVNQVLRHVGGFIIRVNQYNAKQITGVATVEASFAVNTMAITSENKVTEKVKFENSPGSPTHPIKTSCKPVASKPVMPKKKTKNDVNFACRFLVELKQVRKKPEKIDSLMDKKDGILQTVLKKKKTG